MKTTKCIAIIGLSIISTLVTLSADTIVTKQNYPLVETHKQMAITQKNAGGINIFNHKRVVPPVDNQPVIRMNRDTLYSMAIVDARGGATVNIPETNGRYISLMYLDENHRVYDMVYTPGIHKIPAYTDYMYVLFRIGIKSGDLKDMKKIHTIQNQIKLTTTSNVTFVPLKYDKVSYTKTHHAILNSFKNSGLKDTKKMFGTSDYVEHEKYLMGTAIGWGGATWKDNIYQFSKFYKGYECQKTTFKNPKNKGGFWSITVYNQKGFMFNEHANVNSEVAKINKDGTYTVHFGCEGKTNNIPIKNKTGTWNAAMRHYSPSKNVINGTIKAMDTITLVK